MDPGETNGIIHRGCAQGETLKLNLRGPQNCDVGNRFERVQPTVLLRWVHCFQHQNWEHLIAKLRNNPMI